MLLGASTPESWNPIEIDMNEFTILKILEKQGQVEFSDPKFLEWAGEERIDVDALISRLIELRLVARTESAIRLIDPTLITGFTPDGKSWAATDSDRFQLWLAEWMRRRREE